jgi:hypothetical protein
VLDAICFQGGSMKKKASILALAGVLVLSLSAQNAVRGESKWTLIAAPSFTQPLVAGDFSANELFSSAWGGSLGAEYALPLRFPLALGFDFGYSVGGLSPVGRISVDDKVNEISILAGLSPSAPISRGLSVKAFAGGGLTLGSLGSSSLNPYGLLRVGSGLTLGLGESMIASLDASWVQKFGLYGGIGISLGMGYRLPAPASPSAPAKIKLLEFADLGIEQVFPIFRAYYDEHPVGKVKIANVSKETATDLRVSLLIKQYMDGPKECAAIESLLPGQMVELPLYALFNDRILDITEATKATAEIRVEYGADQSQERTASVLVYDRNAMTWDDDRHAAAFVSSKDPWVLDLVGNFISAVKESRNPEVGKNIQTAIALHEGLRVFGIGYVLSPNRPFAQENGNLAAIDSLKFPRQTLGIRSGDCADLSVLYASCFESAGIETAFATVPGHVFMAFDSGLSVGQARERGLDPKSFVAQDGRAWLPLETTMRDSGFAEVWRKAALEWRQAEADGTATLYPIHEAWRIYAPVGLPADGSSVETPAQDEVRAAFRAELAKVVGFEVEARIGALTSRALTAASLLNERGVIYGKYGMLEEAEREFKEAAKDQFTAALVNLGTIAMLKSDPQSAYSYYAQAAQKSPESPRLYLNIARAAAALGKGDVEAQALASAKRLDPKIAEQYSALAKAGPSGTRAAEVGASDFDWF